MARTVTRWRPTTICDDCGRMVTLLVHPKTHRCVPVYTSKWDGVNPWYRRELSNIVHNCPVRVREAMNVRNMPLEGEL